LYAIEFFGLQSVFAQALLTPAVSFAVCDLKYLHDMQFEINRHCTATTSRRVRTSTVPHLYIDCQADVADALSGDSPLALLADGTSRKHYKLEAMMGVSFFFMLELNYFAVRYEVSASERRMAVLGMVPMDHVPSTAANMGTIFKACAVQLGTPIDRFVSAVTDGAAAARLFARQTGALTIHCNAHRVQLVVCAGLSVVPLVQTLNKLQVVVSAPDFRKTMQHYRNVADDDAPFKRVQNLCVPV
jgi:hypothetical protein